MSYPASPRKKSRPPKMAMTEIWRARFLLAERQLARLRLAAIMHEVGLHGHQLEARDLPPLLLPDVFPLALGVAFPLCAKPASGRRRAHPADRAIEISGLVAGRGLGRRNNENRRIGFVRSRNRRGAGVIRPNACGPVRKRRT